MFLLNCTEEWGSREQGRPRKRKYCQARPVPGSLVTKWGPQGSYFQRIRIALTEKKKQQLKNSLLCKPPILVEILPIRARVWISESWLDRTVCDADILIPGYMTFRQDRGPHKRGGGALVYITFTRPASLKNGPRYLKAIFNGYGWKVQRKKFKSFLLCTVYRPPDAPIDFLEHLSETFVDSLLHGSNVIILGDHLLLEVIVTVMHWAIFVRLLVYQNSSKPQQEWLKNPSHL